MCFAFSFRGPAAVLAAAVLLLGQPAISATAASHYDKRLETVQHARGQVLALLQNENACSAWFREVDDDPAATFESLQFKIEKEKEQRYVLRVNDIHEGSRYKQPWAARAWQWSGRNSTVTINPSGPFFYTISPVVELGSGGGILRFSGYRALTIGPFRGDTPEAQITTMLHELGHVTARIPIDLDSWDGKSAKNTEEIVRHCKSEIQEFAKWNPHGSN
jgi:hypothetical protein